jgi:hypothetical protein
MNIVRYPRNPQSDLSAALDRITSMRQKWIGFMTHLAHPFDHPLR